MTKSESRYFNTARKMDEAFIGLLEKKDFAYISVKEICEKAHVNRSTFYLHYETIGDLLAESVEWMNEQFSKYYRNVPEISHDYIQTAPLEKLFLIIPEQLNPYLNYVMEHKSVFRLTLEKPEILHIDQSFRNLLRNVIFPIMERFQVPEEERNYVISFYIEGLIGIVKQWLRCDCRDSVDEIVKIMMEVVKKPESAASPEPRGTADRGESCRSGMKSSGENNDGNSKWS